MEAVANYNFKPTEPDELGFEKGNLLHIIELEEDPYWYKARLGGQEGMVPANYIALHPHPWYVPKCSRREAELRLLETDSKTGAKVQPDGAFILRQSENDTGQFSISVKDEGTVLHFRVFCDPSGLYYIWKNRFQSINALIDFHRQQTIYGSKMVLLRDCLPSRTFGPSGGQQESSGTAIKQMSPGSSAGAAAASAAKNRSTPPASNRSPGGGGGQTVGSSTGASPISFPPGIRSTNLAGRTCVAKYDFIAEFEGEMSFKRGDKIRVLGEEDSNWWYAMLISGPTSDLQRSDSEQQQQQRGLIPANYVELLPGSAHSPGQFSGQPSTSLARS